MRKRIAVFMGEIGREFQKEFTKNIKSVANSRGYDVFIFNNFGSYASTYLYDTGERDIINVPVFSEFEGVISLPDTYDIDGMEKLLIKTIKSQSSCPIISLRNGSKDTYRIVFDDYKTTYEMTNHFIKHHDFTNICYMSGPFNVEDSLKRLNGFKDAMTDAGLKADDSVIFEGDFWKFLSEPAADFFLKAYDGKPQAIICANDYMALGVGEALKARGVRIPEDIAISGFDEVIEGIGYTPVLTTIKTPTEEMARKSLDIIEEANAGLEIPGDTFLTGKLRFKGSCGCNPHTPKLDISFLFNQISDDYVNIRTSTLLTADIQNRITEDDKLSYISDFTERFHFKTNYLCLCTDNYKDDNPYSETMLLRAVFPLSDERNNSSVVGSTFERKFILPEDAYDSSAPKCFVVLPIHHKESTYGYLVTEWEDQDYTMFLAPYTEAIALAYDDLRMQQQFSELVEIKRQNLFDPLTGIYNRRRFEQELSTIRSGSAKADTVSFISADLDNLKIINDTYGHAEGDVAIKTFADVLCSVVGENGICARVGGDEFYVILESDNISIHESFKNLIQQELDKRNVQLNKEYNIHASVGICTVTNDALDKAVEHIQLADSRMYTAKKEYKKSLAD